MLTTRYKQVLNRILQPCASLIARSGISPSAITLATPVLTAGACFWLIRTQRVAPFCAAMGAVGLLDALDGAVARAGGRVTKFGAYLDAMCDRYVEIMVVLTVAYVTGYWVLSGVVLAGSLLVSYAKARAAMEVSVSNQEWPDLMERAERGVFFLIGLVAGAYSPWWPLGRTLFWWTLVILAALTHLTVFQRILRARRFIRERASH